MTKKKIFYLISVFFIVFVAIAGINVRAHPPDNIFLSFNSGTNTLSVTITHGVSDNSRHYINSVEIIVNGSINMSPDPYLSQPSLTIFTYEYTNITKDGSVIQVTASCIQGGSLTRTLGGSTPPPNGGEIPGYLGLYLVLIVSVITLLTMIRKKLKSHK